VSAVDEELEQLGEGVFYWQGDLANHEQTNMGVIVCEGSIVVVDANFVSAARRVLQAIRNAGLGRVTHVVNTHYHVDHSLGNEVFVEAGATIVGAVGQRAELLAKGQGDAVVQTGARVETLYPATLEFAGTIRFYDPVLELRSVGPAHTMADVVAWLPDARVLFVGDLAVAWDHGNNFSDVDADIDGWIRVLDDCIALEPRIVVPAHGRLGTVDDLRDQRAFLAELWQLAQSAHERGATDPEAFESMLARHADYAVDERRLSEMLASLIEARSRLAG
jgi:cyclase